jgi:isocitrate dehydrogenase
MKRITIAKGDGIGPEIMDATLKIIKASGVELHLTKLKSVKKFTFRETQLESPKNLGM